MGLCSERAVPGLRQDQRPLNDSIGTDFGRPAATALSFDFQGTLRESVERADARTFGIWSFEVDAPPTCSSLTEEPYNNLFEYCVCFDNTLPMPQAQSPYFWHSPQAFAALHTTLEPYASSRVNISSAPGLTTRTSFAVYRRFVNEPPQIIILEPTSSLLRTFEDHAAYVSLQVTHKATEQLVGCPLEVSLMVFNGHLRTLSQSAAVRIADGRRRLNYRAPLQELNNFLVQIEYVPDHNYAGSDELIISVSDMEFFVNSTIPIEVAPLTDPLTVVCPPAVDLMEGSSNVLIGSNITLYDNDQVPGEDDSSVEVSVEMFVGAGTLSFLPDVLLNSSDRADLVNITSLMGQAAGTLIPAIRFNSTLAGLRLVLQAVTFTPEPYLFNGVLQFRLAVRVMGSGEEASCDIGLVVNPVNSAPTINVDQTL